MKERMQQFCEETTAHGVANLVRRKTKRRLTSWWFIVLSVFGGTIYHLSSLLPTYFKFDYEEIIRTTYSSNLSFPSVTLCNLQIISPQEFTRIIDLYFNLTIFRDPSCSPEAPTSGLSTVNKLNRSTGAPYLFFEYFDNHFPDISHKLKDLLVECYYNGVDCSNDFELFVDPNFHNCFTFNVPTTSDQRIRSDGPNGGLSVILFVNNNKYTPLTYMGTDLYAPFSPKIPTSSAAGARVTIHTPGTLPRNANRGFDAPVGHSTSVILSGKYNTRLEAPYKSNCTKQTEIPGTKFIYTQSMCLLHCLQEETVSKCSCLNSITSEKFRWQNLSFCGGLHLCNYTKQGEKLQCQYTVEENLRKEESELYSRCVTRCPLPCSDYTYSTSKSTSRWPGKYYLKAFHRWMKTEKANDTIYGAFIASLNETFVEDSLLIEDNFLRLNVYFENVEVEHTKQVIAYPIDKLFADIGGAFGLWVGISIVTICEIFELLLDLLIGVYRRQTTQRVSHVTVQPKL